MMAYSFLSKQWTVDGECKFSEEFTLLNPIITPKNLQIVEGNAFLHLAVQENGGVFIHNAHLRMESPSQTNINSLVEAMILEAFPEAKVVA